jgi:hypothetical protein
MRNIAIASSVILAASACLTACAPTPPSVAFNPLELRTHVIVVDPDGHPLEPSDNYTKLYDAKLAEPMSPYAGRVDEILRTMDAFNANRDDAQRAKEKESAGGDEKKRVRKILIFVHGGMHTLAEARDNAIRVYTAMKHDPKYEDVFPILINWQSDWGTTYTEHLHLVRQGNKANDPAAVVAAPLFVLGDLGRGVTNAPVTWMNLGDEDAQTAAAAISGWRPDIAVSDSMWSHPRLQIAGQFFLHLNERYLADYAKPPEMKTALEISVGDNLIGRQEWIGRGITYAISVPSKLATAPFIDGFGRPAWEMMCRRTTTMFESPDAFVPSTMSPDGKHPEKIEDAIDHGSAGAVSYLMRRLVEKTGGEKRAANDPEYEITIIAHSMGAIVANNILDRFTQLPVKNIVYMAPACTINDGRRSVVPFLEANPKAHFYCLCLHPVAETLDTEAHDFVPRGSLLVWIDNFLENPRTPLDRMMGRWENIVRATYVFDRVRNRVHIKGYALLPEKASADERRVNPQTHGAFSRVDFWDEEFWKPGPPRGGEDALRRALEKAEKKGVRATQTERGVDVPAHDLAK